MTALRKLVYGLSLGVFLLTPGPALVFGAGNPAARLYRLAAKKGRKTNAAYWGNPGGTAYSLISGNHYVGVHNSDGSRILRMGDPSSTYEDKRSSCLLMVKRFVGGRAVQESYSDVVCGGQVGAILMERTPGGLGDLDAAGWKRVVREFSERFLGRKSKGAAPLSSFSPEGIYTAVLRFGRKEATLLFGNKNDQVYALKSRSCRLEILDRTQKYRRSKTGRLLSKKKSCAFSTHAAGPSGNVVVVYQDRGCRQKRLRRVLFGRNPTATAAERGDYESGLRKCAAVVLKAAIYEAWQDYSRGLAKRRGRKSGKTPVVITGPRIGARALDYAGLKAKQLKRGLKSSKRRLKILTQEYRRQFGEPALESYLERGPWYMTKTEKGGEKSTVTLKDVLGSL